jgi:hypothetical protein
LKDENKHDILFKNNIDIGPVLSPTFLRRFSLRGNLSKHEENPIILDFNWKRFLQERTKSEPIELQKSIYDFKQSKNF